MAQNGTEKDRIRELCATLLADGDKTQEEIVKDCGISRRTLNRWQAEPEFKSRVGEIKKINSEQTVNDGIARKDNRLAIYQDLANRIETIITERAAQMALTGTLTDADGNEIEFAKIPGGKSGLLTRSYDKLGREVYRFDAALAREYRETLKQAAIEKGQWTEKREASGAVTVTVKYEDNEPDDYTSEAA
jgi:hypothetical protein